MAYLGTPTATAEIIRKYGFAFQKKYGQNFLIDANILKKIVSSAEITTEDCVMEIGPGIGALTQHLAESAGQVIAVEIDRKLIPILEETLADYDNVTVLNEDILKVDMGKLAGERNGGRPLKVVANLPYYITTPIIMGLFESHAPLSDMTVMVQTEVAERMQAGPGGKEYGPLSLAVQYYARPEIVMHVPPSCFMPRPGVGSSVIRLTRRTDRPVEGDERFLFSVIRAAFNQRRKTLANALANAPCLTGDGGGSLSLTREIVCDVLEGMGLKPTIRGEALNLEQFAELSRNCILHTKNHMVNLTDDNRTIMP